MRSAMAVIIAMQMCAAIAAAKVAAENEFPDAPSSVAIAKSAPVAAVTNPISPRPAEGKRVEVKFVSLAIISTGSAFADSYTTLFARQNWLAGKKGVCNVEVESAYLYGAHPTVARSYAVASVKSASAIAAAYYLRRHHSKFWGLPLAANAIIGLQGVTQNMVTCN